jgi:uncharacterized protein YjaG (DUF416 family)
MQWRVYGRLPYAPGLKPPVEPEVHLIDSTFIAASAATSTTQRLTGLTGTFTAGRISDDTNPLPSIDIGNNGNTEVEFVVKIASSVANGTQFKFRITDNGTPLDTYTVTPTVTVNTGGGHTVTVGQVTETDSVFAISKIKTKTVSQVSETDTAQAITRLKKKVVGQVSETDTAFAVSKIKTKLLGQTSETDLAQPITSGGSHIVTVNQVTETDTAFAVSKIKLKTVSQTNETDTANAITVHSVKIRIVNQVTETDTANSVFKLKLKVLTQITEVDTANPINWNPKKRLVLSVTEIDTANPISTGAIERKSGVSVKFIDGVSLPDGVTQGKHISLDD